MIQDIVSFISMQHFTTDNSTKDKKKKKSNKNNERIISVVYLFMVYAADASLQVG